MRFFIFSLILPFIYSFANKTCVDPKSAQNKIKELFFTKNISINYGSVSINSTPYCQDLINWPVSQDTIDNFQIYDTNALAMYTGLYQKWKIKEGDNPSNDCLGIGRIVFCTYQYKFCNIDKGTDENSICQFLCDIWTDRCPEETETFKIICSGSKATECAFANILNFWLQTLLILCITIFYLI